MDLAVARFKSGVNNFKDLLADLVEQLEKEREDLRSGVEKEREELQRSREQLKAEKQSFEEESRRVHQVLNESEQIELNVGGHRFTTTVLTLRNAPSPSLFNAMFSGRHSLKKDKDGCCFIDRDGRHFHDILNYLRDGQLNYPLDGPDHKYLLELRAEAEYYGLCGLVSKIDRYPYCITKVQRAANLNIQDSWMYEDGRDEVVFTVDRQCQLLGVGLCGTDGGYTVECELYEVDSVDFSIELSCLREVAQSFTKTDGQLVKLFFPSPATVMPSKYYMISALIKGNESYCCEDCISVVIASGVRIQFECWESPNGTNEQRGQFPELYFRMI